MKTETTVVPVKAETNITVMALKPDPCITPSVLMLDPESQKKSECDDKNEQKLGQINQHRGWPLHGKVTVELCEVFRPPRDHLENEMTGTPDPHGQPLIGRARHEHDTGGGHNRRPKQEQANDHGQMPEHNRDPVRFGD